MSLFLSIFGFSIACVGVIGLLSPRRLRELWTAGDVRSRFHSAIMTRIIVGGLLIGAASSSRYPMLVTYLGVATLLAAVFVWLRGRERFYRISSWWSERPMMSVRAASMVALAFGLFLYYAPV